VLRLSLILGMGFGLLLAIFPFIPGSLAGRISPIRGFFRFLMLPGRSSSWPWVFSTPMPGCERFTDRHCFALDRIMDDHHCRAMVGIPKALSRILAYALILEIGSLSCPQPRSYRAGRTNLVLFFALLVHALSLGVWALALTVFRQEARTSISHRSRGWAGDFH
jgi:hypothetical protein